MKATYIGNYLITASGNLLTLLEVLPGLPHLKQIAQLSLDAEFWIIPMAAPTMFSTIGYDKKFRIWFIDPALISSEPFTLKYCCSFPKKLTHGTSSVLGSKEYIFIADKFGDVYMIDTEKAVTSHNLEDKMIRQDHLGPTAGEDLLCKFIMGHQEVINFVFMNEAKDFLVTIDKANKVKVSKVPKFFEIHGIHFGHHEEIIFAKMLDKYELITIDKSKEAIIWDISKEENAILLRGKLNTSNIVSATAVNKDNIIVSSEDKTVTLYEINRAGKSLIEKGKKPLPEEILPLELFGNVKAGEDKISITVISVNENIKAIQDIIMEF